MKSFIAFLVMIVWSAAIFVLMELLGFGDPVRELAADESSIMSWGQKLIGAIILLIGFIGNVWIYLTIVGEQPWQWGRKKE